MVSNCLSLLIYNSSKRNSSRMTLVGLGYKKVVVTQPRRLPCSQIYQRITEVFGEGVAGYEVADSKRDTSNSLIYMTDGLLKMKANYD